MTKAKKSTQKSAPSSAVASAGKPYLKMTLNELFMHLQKTDPLAGSGSAFMPSDATRLSLILPDPSLHLWEQQIRDCRTQTTAYAKGDPDAVRFFAGCEEGSKQGVHASANMLAFRNAILREMGWPGPSEAVLLRHENERLSIALKDAQRSASDFAELRTRLEVEKQAALDTVQRLSTEIARIGKNHGLLVRSHEAVLNLLAITEKAAVEGK